MHVSKTIRKIKLSYVSYAKILRKSLRKKIHTRECSLKEQPITQVTHFRNSNFKHKLKRLRIPQKLVYEKFYVHEKILRTRNYRRRFIKNLLPEKRKENM